jgi:hypothetical protein
LTFFSSSGAGTSPVTVTTSAVTDTSGVPLTLASAALRAEVVAFDLNFTRTDFASYAGPLALSGRDFAGNGRGSADTSAVPDEPVTATSVAATIAAGRPRRSN